MRIVCLGGGPAGLYFAITMKLRNPDHEVVVVERNRPDDTFGWGVVLSDETLENLTRNDPVSAAAIRSHFAYWDDIAVNYRGTRTVSSGHGFCGIGRRTLLLLLQARARELGVELRFETEVESAAAYARDYDLVVAADGLNSKIRSEYRRAFQAGDRRAANASSSGSARTRNSTTPSPSSSRRPSTAGCGRTPTSSTTTPRPSSSNAPRRRGEKFGFGEMTQEESIATCERIFRDHLGGHALMSNAAPHPRLGLAQFSARALRALAPREHRADGRRRRDRAFLHRLGHQARARKRHRARRATVETEADARGRLREIRGRAPRRGAAAAVGRAQLGRMVRGGRSAISISIRCSSTIRC